VSATTRVTLKVRVLHGPACAFVFHVSSSIVDPDDPVILGLIAVLEAVTRGKVLSIEISLRAATEGSAATGVPYISEDKALMRFTDEFSQAHAYKIPGLMESILNANHETVDATNADVITFNNAVLDEARTRAGDAIDAFTSGHRIENRKPIKAGAVL